MAMIFLRQLRWLDGLRQPGALVWIALCVCLFGCAPKITPSSKVTANRVSSSLSCFYVILGLGKDRVETSPILYATGPVPKPEGFQDCSIVVNLKGGTLESELQAIDSRCRKHILGYGGNVITNWSSNTEGVYTSHFIYSEEESIGIIFVAIVKTGEKQGYCVLTHYEGDGSR
jgi:hypothetical protein